MIVVSWFFFFSFFFLSVGERRGKEGLNYVCLGQPFLWLFKEQERRKGGLSISHDGEYLVAMAMI